MGRRQAQRRLNETFEASWCRRCRRWHSTRRQPNNPVHARAVLLVSQKRLEEVSTSGAGSATRRRAMGRAAWGSRRGYPRCLRIQDAGERPVAGRAVQWPGRGDSPSPTRSVMLAMLSTSQRQGPADPDISTTTSSPSRRRAAGATSRVIDPTPSRRTFATRRAMDPRRGARPAAAGNRCEMNKCWGRPRQRPRVRQSLQSVIDGLEAAASGVRTASGCSTRGWRQKVLARPPRARREGDGLVIALWWNDGPRWAQPASASASRLRTDRGRICAEVERKEPAARVRARLSGQQRPHPHSASRAIDALAQAAT